MRLKSHLPSLSPHLHPLLPLLSSIQIAQSQTLLFTPSTEILSLLPPDSGFTLKDIEQLQKEVGKLESPPFQRGGVLLEAEMKMQERKKSMWAGVGEKGLDGLLEGVGEGVGGGGVVEISGEGGTKSLVCLHIVMNHLIHNPTTTALWIDTEGEFSGEKALAVLETKHSELDPTSVLDRLVIQRMFDLPPFSELVSKLHLDLAEPPPLDDENADGEDGASPPKHRSKGFSLLIVDSITSLYENFIAAAELEGRASLISHLHYLSTLSRSYPLLTILTNHSIPTTKNHNNPHSQPYPFPSRIARSNTRPALDSVFSHLTDLTLWLELPAGYAGGGEGWVVVAQVLRNRIGRSGTFSAFHTNGTELRTHASLV